MADNESRGTALPIPQIVAVLTAVVAMFMPQKTPLSSSRPPAKGLSKPETAPAELRNINARLWQDPLQAVEQFRNNLRADKKLSSEEFIAREDADSEDRIERLQAYIKGSAEFEVTDPKSQKKSKAKTLILVGCLSSVTNSENVERRLRTRWAILAALGRSGYVPREQIGYFILNYKEGRFGPPNIPGEHLSLKARVPIPFETIEPQYGKAEWCSDPTFKRVVLVWLPDDWMGTRCLELLGQLGQTMDWADKPAEKPQKKLGETPQEKSGEPSPGKWGEKPPESVAVVRVIGPTTSTVLTQFADYVTYLKDDIKKNLKLLLEMPPAPSGLESPAPTPPVPQPYVPSPLTQYFIAPLAPPPLLGAPPTSAPMQVSPAFPLGQAALVSFAPQPSSAPASKKLPPEKLPKLEDVDEVVQNYCQGAFRRMEMLAALPTISNALLGVFLERDLKADSDPCASFRNGLADLQIKFRRTISPDDIVAAEMINELNLRGIRVFGRSGEGLKNVRADDIAVIAEWDTPYGRCLPLTLGLMTMLANENPQIVGTLQELPNGSEFSRTFNLLGTMVNRGPLEKDNDGDQAAFFNLLPRNIHQFYYFKGIDGNAPSQDAGTKEKDRDGAKLEEFWPVPRPAVERATGENQADYLRRVAAHLQENDRELRSEGRHIRAVLVLGSDLYDKFLVMRAIRSVMPDALFMTNNLDADMALLDEFGGNQNLVVVSPFGLSLSEYYQRGVPPFRDSYQTATFAATLAATRCLNPSLYPDPQKSDKNNFWTPPALLSRLDPADIAGRRPRIYETGRTGFFDLSRDFGNVMYGFTGLKQVTTAEELVTRGTRMHPLRTGPDSWLGRLQQDESRWRAWWLAWLLFFAAVVMLAIHLVRSIYHPRRPALGGRAQKKDSPRKLLETEEPVVDSHSPKKTNKVGVAQPAFLDQVALAMERLRPFRDKLLAAMARTSVAVVLVMLAVVVVPVILFWFQAIGGKAALEGGEPLSWTEGVSVWPTQGLSLAALLVLVHLLCRTYLAHVETEKLISKFLLGWIKSKSWWGRWQLVLLILSLAPALLICLDWDISLHGRTHLVKLAVAIVVLGAAFWLHVDQENEGRTDQAKKKKLDLTPIQWGVVSAIFVALLIMAGYFNRHVFTPPIFSAVVVLSSVLAYGREYKQMEKILWYVPAQKMKPARDKRASIDKPEINPGEKWRLYLGLGCFQKRVPRILLLTNALLWLAVLFLECWPPAPCPARGGFALLCEDASFGMCLLALSFISAVVVDAVLLNRIFTITFHMSRSKWADYYSKIPLSLLLKDLGDGLNEYLDMRLLAFRSKPVANLIYCPFIVLAFVVVSQNHLLDAFPLHPPLVIIWSINLALGCFCAWLLQCETNRARSEALRFLTHARALVERDKILAEQERGRKLGIFDRVTAEIRDLRDGAFAPLWDQPFVRAIFFSSGSIGLTSIISALSGWWK